MIRGAAALWAPVFWALGVALFFALPQEPPAGSEALAGALAFLAGGLAAALPRAARLGAAAAIAAALISAGFAAAAWRTAAVAAPVWPPELRSPVTLSGQVVRVETRVGRRARVTLEHVEIASVAPELVPKRIRLTLRDGAPPMLGAWVAARATLFPPPGPAEPGAFDFRFRAWFDGLGALGVVDGALRPTERAGPTTLRERLALELNRLRADIAARARAAAPGREGGVIAALLVGERSGVDPGLQQALRDSNLAHLLAISGLHMGILCLTVFGLVRLALALFPRFSGRFDAKKTAAIAALVVGAGYLALSGAGTPTQRAFIMAAVAFGAILVDRPPVTLRAVAAAALIILTLRPESLYDIGFQLSFAATTAMVAFFEATAPFWRRGRERRGAIAWFFRGLAALAASSAIAALATAPFAALAFNQASRYGLVANLAAVPAMGTVIMPAGLLAAVLAPFGWEQIGFEIMALGVRYVAAVAETVAAWPNAAIPIAAGPSWLGAAFAVGGLLLCLCRGVWRFVGVAPLLLGVALWSGTPRPDLLIAPAGRLVGVMTADGRVLDRASGAGFAADLWLRRDGDPVTQRAAAARPGMSRRDEVRVFDLPAPPAGDGRVAAWVMEGWPAPARAEAAASRVAVWLARRPTLAEWRLRCLPDLVLIAPRADAPAAWASDGAPCVLFDRTRLRALGALALRRTPDGRVEIRSAHRPPSDLVPIEPGRVWARMR